MTPTTQEQFAELVNDTQPIAGRTRHRIRAGYEHRFIDLMFVTVGDRAFCRRYTYGEPSWHSAFAGDPEGQVMLDETVIDVLGRVPNDLEQINPQVNEAYRVALEQVGASYMVDGAIEPRAMASTIELTVNPFDSAGASSRLNRKDTW